MVHYDHSCDLVEYYVFDIQFLLVVPNFDTQADIIGIVGQKVNTVDQLQLLHDQTLIQPLL